VIDVDYIDHLMFHISKLGAQKKVEKCEDLNPEKTFKLTIKRIGAYLAIEVNDKEVTALADVVPMPAVNISSLYMFFWGKAVTIEKMSIMIRPSLCDMDKVLNPGQLVSFKRSPGKLYSFTSEPIRYLNQEFLFVHFSPVPILQKKEKKQQSIILFEEARQYIEDNYYSRIDFEALAKKCCLSYVPFIRKFKSLYGLPPKAYQVDCKLREAKIFLKSGKYKVREVGEMVGIEDEVQFQHLFRNHFKMSPKKWANSGLD
jgi:AraC-like DNA-binding protein